MVIANDSLRRKRAYSTHNTRVCMFIRFNDNSTTTTNVMTIRQHDKRSVDGERKGQKRKKLLCTIVHVQPLLCFFFFHLQKKLHTNTSLWSIEVVIIDIATRINSFKTFQKNTISSRYLIEQKSQCFCLEMTLFVWQNCDSLLHYILMYVRVCVFIKSILHEL